MTIHSHPLLQLTLPRTHQARRRLQAMLWSPAGEVDVQYMSAEKDAQTLMDIREQPFESITLPFHWGRLMHTRWFHLRFSKNNSGEARYVRWRDQGEGTLYIDGAPYYGFGVKGLSALYGVFGQMKSELKSEGGLRNERICWSNREIPLRIHLHSWPMKLSVCA